jgi:hypothetical protein
MHTHDLGEPPPERTHMHNDTDDPNGIDHEAAAAVTELREALALHNITLRDLGIDLGGAIVGFAWVRLGSAPAETARRLAAALRRAA